MQVHGLLVVLWLCTIVGGEVEEVEEGDERAASSSVMGVGTLD